jgi:hypothetical protein
MFSLTTKSIKWGNIHLHGATFTNYFEIKNTLSHQIPVIAIIQDVSVGCSWITSFIISEPYCSAVNKDPGNFHAPSCQRPRGGLNLLWQKRLDDVSDLQLNPVTGFEIFKIHACTSLKKNLVA